MKHPGKIERHTLRTLFRNKLGKPSDKIIQGSAFGVDSGIISITGNKSMIVASDPASFIPSLGVKESAWLTVILTANDVATSGHLPEYAQFILNLPHTITDNELKTYWEHIHQFCMEIGMSITGGHTGFDMPGSSTLAGGTTMFAIADTAMIKSSSDVQPRQDLILTKSAALSSASILARSFPNHIKEKLGKAVYEDLVNSFYQTSILPEIKIIRNNPVIYNSISAMHDVTEGGSLGAIYELCEAGNIGVKIYASKILTGEAQKEICNLFQINPLRSIGAGSLLIACEKGISAALVKEFQNKNIPAVVVGESLPLNEGRKIIDNNGEKELTYRDRDPYWDAFADAIKKGIK